MADEPVVLATWGMDIGNERASKKARSDLREKLEIARQCREAAVEIAEAYPIAARILQQESLKWL